MMTKVLFTYYFHLCFANFPVEIDVHIEDTDENIIRNTTEGLVLGEKRNNSLAPGESYYAFHAIPYAAAPIGSLRFMPPQNPGKFKEVYNASNADDYKKCCIQWTVAGYSNLRTSEDCLFLSVYTTMSKSCAGKSEELLPVIVWIHGGGLYYGCGMFPDYGPERIIRTKDVVMVSINYRLGLFGFLSIGNEKLAGNMGFLDQVMALQWVQRNIKQFGGDPARVTIMGESAGSWSVFYHMMSPRSKNLFHQVIGQSGSVVSPRWREYTEGEAKRWGQRVASHVGCGAFRNVSAQISCLQKLDVEVLASSEFQAGFNGPNAVVDGNISKEPFLPDHPKSLMDKGKYNKNINVMLGCNRDEEILMTKAGFDNHATFDNWRTNWRNGLGAFLLFGVENGMQDDTILAGVDNITNFYLGSLKNMNIFNIAKVTELITDSCFCYGMHDFVTRHLPHAPAQSILQYKYVHEGEYSMAYSSKRVFEGPYGVAHGDETIHQFQPFFHMSLQLNNADTLVSNNLLELWINFIKSGNASTSDVAWIPVKGPSDRRYLRLTYAASSYMEYPKAYEEKMATWDKVLKKINENRRSDIGTVSHNGTYNPLKFLEYLYEWEMNPRLSKSFN